MKKKIFLTLLLTIWVFIVFQFIQFSGVTIATSYFNKTYSVNVSLAVSLHYYLFSYFWPSCFLISCILIFYNRTKVNLLRYSIVAIICLPAFIFLIQLSSSYPNWALLTFSSSALAVLSIIFLSSDKVQVFWFSNYFFRE